MKLQTDEQTDKRRVKHNFLGRSKYLFTTPWLYDILRRQAASAASQPRGPLVNVFEAEPVNPARRFSSRSISWEPFSAATDQLHKPTMNITTSNHYNYKIRSTARFTEWPGQAGAGPSSKLIIHSVWQVQLLQRRAVQIINGNMPYEEACRLLNILPLADRRLELCRTLFQQIMRDDTHVFHHLLPPKRDTQLTGRLRSSRTYPTIYARTSHYKTSFILHGLNKFQRLHSITNLHNCFLFTYDCVSVYIMYV